jgi:hypothetical protein
MRKIIGIAAIMLLASGYAAAADYWHFGLGLRATGVMPGDKYANALGVGVLLTLGDPDSRFTTQFDLDRWSVGYTKEGSMILYSTLQQLADGDTLYRLTEFEYSGLGVGFFEKYRALDFSSSFSTYVIGGIGGYFLDPKQELRNDDGTVTMKSNGLHALVQYAAGLGIEGRFNQHFYSFVEGRFVGVVSGDANDPNLIKGYFGVRYVF